MNDDCIFCKIVAGELPAATVYEDDDVIAFMDIGPVIKGHTLVVPKAHSESVADTPDELLAKMIVVVKRIAHAQSVGLAADGVNVTQANGAVAGQVVPHIHFHVIPRFDDDNHHWNWVSHQYDTGEEMNAFADKIKTALADG